MQCACLGIGDEGITKAPTNGPIEKAALGGRLQQGVVHRCGNAEILIDLPAPELQLQKLTVPS